jgi:hypothetical protein
MFPLSLIWVAQGVLQVKALYNHVRRRSGLRTGCQRHNFGNHARFTWRRAGGRHFEYQEYWDWREVMSDSSEACRVVGLPAGRYEVEAVARGFPNEKSGELSLTVAEETVVKFSL